MDVIDRQPAARLAQLALGPALLAAILGAAAFVASVALSKPIFAAAAAGVGLLGLVVAATPNAATVVALVLLYSNAVVVATHFHGVPGIVAPAVVALLGVPFVHELAIRRQPIVVHPAAPLLLLFLTVQSLGAMFSRDPAASWAVVLEYALEGFALFILITNVIRTPQMIRYATWAMLIGGLIMTIAPIYQQLTHSFDNTFGGFGQTTEIGFRTGEVTSQGEVTQVRLCGTIGEQNRFAQNALMLVPLGLLLLTVETGRCRRGIALCVAGAAAMGCALAFSRGAAVAFIATIAVMVAMRMITRRQLAVMALGVVIILAIMPQYLVRIATIPDVAKLVGMGNATSEEPDGALKGRATEMLAAAQVFVDHPVIGVGPGLYPRYSRVYGNKLGIRRLDEDRAAHSLYLGLAAETGALGLGCFLAMVGVTMLGLLRARSALAEEKPELAAYAAAYFTALVAFLASGMFLHMAFIRFFFMVFAVAAAVTVVAGTANLRDPAQRVEEARR